MYCIIFHTMLYIPVLLLLNKHSFIHRRCDQALCSIHHSPSNHNTYATEILTNIRPCIQAYEKLMRGELSSSSRVTIFLSTKGRYRVHIKLIDGVANLVSDCKPQSLLMPQLGLSGMQVRSRDGRLGYTQCFHGRCQRRFCQYAIH